jgi:glycosyltransferase involved in cell wall biosynthesis
MPVILNTSELFRFQGSGIKSFAQSVLHSSLGFIPIQLLLEAKRKEPNNELIHTNLFHLHPPSSGVAGVVKREIKQSLKSYAPGRFAHIAPLVSRHDPLNGLALSRLQLDDEKQERDPECISFRAGFNIFGDSHLRFIRTGQCSEIKFAGKKSGGKESLIFHNPLPFPLLPVDVPMIVTVHDLIPLSHSELCLDDPSRFYELLDILIEKAAAVHAISHYTGNMLVKVFGERVQSKLRVIHQALTQRACAPEQDEAVVAKKLSIFDSFHHGDCDHSLLQLGTLEPKKNHAITLEAHRILRRRFPGLRLLIIGKEGWLCNDLVNSLPLRASNDVEWLQSAPRSSVRWHLNNSLAVVFPSIVEGWGLPPLEAMAAGTPAVCSDIPACQEACGEGAAGMASPHDVEGFCTLLTELLTDRERYEAAVRAGLRQARLYSQERFREELLELYGSVMPGGN